jgi:hypothetical protein
MIAEENEHRDRLPWKLAREAVDAVGADGMSGEETDGQISGREKQLVRVPVQWINSELTELFHTMDTWKSAVNDESMVSSRGNRPIARLAKSKEPAVGNAVKGLPRNWYEDIWYKSQSDPKKLMLNVIPTRPIPSLVSLIHFYIAYHCVINRLF